MARIIETWFTSRTITMSFESSTRLPVSNLSGRTHFLSISLGNRAPKRALAADQLSSASSVCFCRERPYRKSYRCCPSEVSASHTIIGRAILLYREFWTFGSPRFHLQNVVTREHLLVPVVSLWLLVLTAWPFVPESCSTALVCRGSGKKHDEILAKLEAPLGFRKPYLKIIYIIGLNAIRLG